MTNDVKCFPPLHNYIYKQIVIQNIIYELTYLFIYLIIKCVFNYFTYSFHVNYYIKLSIEVNEMNIFISFCFPSRMTSGT